MKSMKSSQKNPNTDIIENREYIIEKQKEDLASCLAQRKVSKSSLLYCLQSASTMNQRKKREIGDDNLENHDLSSYVEVFKRSIEYDDDFENDDEDEVHHEEHFDYHDYKDPNYYQLDHHENEYYQLENGDEEYHEAYETHETSEASEAHDGFEHHVDEHTQHHDEHKYHDNGIMEMITNLPNIMNHLSN